MQLGAATELGAQPTLVQLPDFVNSGWVIPPEDAELPLISRSIRQRRSGRVREFGISMAALAAVAVVATVYLVLRCGLDLGSSHTSRASPRFLSGAEGARRKDTGEHCSAPEEDPTAAAAASSSKAKKEPIVKQELLRQARRYVDELKRLITQNKGLLMQLGADPRAKCLAEFLCLAVAECSALFTLLEKKERAGIGEAVSAISSQIWIIRNSFGEGALSNARFRHIKHLHAVLSSVASIKPPPAANAERQRLQQLKNLLQLQDMALGQVNAGFAYLRGAVERMKKAKGDAKASAADAETGAAAAAEGISESRISAVIKSIETTTHVRKEQVLIDPSLSQWLRETQMQTHFGITTRIRLEKLMQSPLQSHPELLEALLATPLASGEDPGDQIGSEELGAEPSTSSSVHAGPSQRKKPSPSKGSRRAPRAPKQLKSPRQRSGKDTDAAASAPLSSSPTPSTTAYAAAAAVNTTGVAAADEVQEPSHPKEMPRSTASKIPSHISPLAATGSPEVVVESVTPQPTVVSSAGTHGLPAAWVSSASGVTSAATPLELSPPREAFLGSLSSTLSAAVSAATAYSPDAFTLWAPGTHSQLPVADPTPTRSWPSPTALGSFHASAASQPSPAVTIPLQRGFTHVPSSSGFRHGYSFPPRSHVHAPPSHYPSSASVAASAPLRPPPGFQPLRSWRPVEHSSSSEGAESRLPVDIFGRTVSYRQWGLSSTPASGFSPTTEIHAPSSAISAGFKELAERFSGASVKDQGGPRHPRHRKH